MIGAEPAEPTMVVRGQLYRVSVQEGGIILTKSTGESHVIIDGACSCSDHHYRSQADPSHRCKHVLACIDGGFLPPITPETPHAGFLEIETDTPSADFPEATMPDDHTMALMAFGLMPISGGSPEATVETVKVGEYRDRTDALSQAFVSLRSASRHRPGEREREAAWVRNAARDLMNATCPRATPEDRQKAEWLIDQTATYLTDNGL